ncbi:hypothetical protein DFA_11393 [Cavenderia fasciculata]|uniref:Secreted protein n=1 Tax=Cavenderia fasciculata TaxID=261658 RepID=F4QCQ0_CACFS|nr:uncharacterized protein DFA_11393 [Cavenderia fasciculata]EGG13632.1 hypothetical protein DFA_11393 [Cavenderia fasciculata]|eukprot:XP_004350336.1 hypothetical protein DFA_11393 [Cavenderia fasciculata]
MNRPKAFPISLVALSQTLSVFHWLGSNCCGANGIEIGSGINLWIYDPCHPAFGMSSFPFHLKRLRTNRLKGWKKGIHHRRHEPIMRIVRYMSCDCDRYLRYFS